MIVAQRFSRRLPWILKALVAVFVFTISLPTSIGTANDEQSLDDAQITPKSKLATDQAEPWSVVKDQRLQLICRTAFLKLQAISSWEFVSTRNDRFATAFAFESGKYRADTFETPNVQRGVLLYACAYDGKVFQTLSPKIRTLELQNGFPKNDAVTKSVYPFGEVNPMVVPYFWMFEKGEQHYWSGLVSVQRWTDRFRNARWLYEEKQGNLTLSVVEFRKSEGEKVYTTQFVQELGFYPLRTDIYDEEGDSIYFAEVEQYKQVDRNGVSTIVPLRVNYNIVQVYDIDPDSIQIHHDIPDAKFSIESSPSYHVRDLSWAENVFRDSKVGLDEIEQAFAEATHQRKHVLLFFGEYPSASSTQWAEIFFGRRSLPSMEIGKLLKEFVLIPVSTKDTQLFLKVADQFGLDIGLPDVPHVVALDSNQQVLGSLSHGEAIASNEDAKASILDFLMAHLPPRENALEKLQAAIELAAGEEKHVIFQVTGPACGPCLLLSQFFAQNWQLFERDYIYIKVDGRDTDAGQARDILGKRGLGIPWVAIVNGSGDVVATSVGPNGNIGFPSSPEEIDHFVSMLEETSRHMSHEDFEQLREVLSKRQNDRMGEGRQGS